MEGNIAMPVRTEAQIRHEWYEAHRLIEAAYLAFTQQYGAEPPSAVCPHAFETYARCENELRHRWQLPPGVKKWTVGAA